MSATLLPNNDIQIEAYNLQEFVFLIAEHALSGYLPTLENNKQPEGMYGSSYTATLVPINQPRYGLKGEKINFPEEALKTSTETAQTSDASVINGASEKTTPTESPDGGKDAVNEPTESSSDTTEVSTAIKTPTKRGAKK